MKKANPFTKPIMMVSYFALFNVLMYISIHRFWIGGSSFLPMIGRSGPQNKFVFAFVVNMGVIAGSFLGALLSKEFTLRLPKAPAVGRGILGGILIGIGITLAPGTCTTVFVTGIPMLSVSSFLSGAGIFIGGYIAYRLTSAKCSRDNTKE